MGVLEQEAAVWVCWPRWVNLAVVVNGLGLGSDAQASAFAPARDALRCVCKVSVANEHTLPHLPLAVLSNAAAHG